MIHWCDFVLVSNGDDFFGPVLSFEESREQPTGRSSVMDDTQSSTFQETGQMRRPARMAGLSSSDSVESISMDADRSESVALSRRGGEA